MEGICSANLNIQVALNFTRIFGSKVSFISFRIIVNLEVFETNEVSANPFSFSNNILQNKKLNFKQSYIYLKIFPAIIHLLTMKIISKYVYYSKIGNTWVYVLQIDKNILDEKLTENKKKKYLNIGFSLKIE